MKRLREDRNRLIDIFLQQAALAAPALAQGSSPLGAKQSGGSGAKPSLSICQPTQELTSMAVSPDGTKIASTSKSGILFVNDSATGQLLGGSKVDMRPKP